MLPGNDSHFASLRDVLGSASGESEVEAQVILKSRVEVPPSQLPFLVCPTKLAKQTLQFFQIRKMGFKVQTHECLVHPLP